MLFAAFGRWGERMGWRGRQADTISFRRPDDVAVTPTQRACAYFFLVVGLLFVVQTLVGAASEHYRADLTSFFGFDLARWLPYNLVRTWHVQLAIFWTATSFLATGLFLAPIVSGAEPRRQSWLAYGLLGALAVVVFGSLIGELLDIHGWLSPALHAIGMQGWEYLDLGRVWQVLLDRWACSSGRSCCSAGCGGPCSDSPGSTCPGCSSSPGSRSRRSTRWAC